MATKTAAARREQERSAYDAYMDQCPSRQLLSTLSDKWVVLAMTALAAEPLRYSEVRRVIAGVSQKMLTQTLRNAERNGLVTRTAQLSVPVTVTYALTDLGQSLLTVVRELKSWAEDNMGHVQVARDAYDAIHDQTPATVRAGN